MEHLGDTGAGEAREIHWLGGTGRSGRVERQGDTGVGYWEIERLVTGT